MEIVIENEPTYRPSSASPAPGSGYHLCSPGTVPPPQPFVSTNNAFYFATLPRRSLAPPEPTAPTIRRTDKSGLLEVSSSTESAESTAARRRHLLESHATLSRRLERLESVPEVPDPCHRLGGVSEELLAAAATTRSMVERQQHLLGAENDIAESAALLRRAASLANEAKDSPILPKDPSTRRVKFTDECTTFDDDIIPPPPPPCGTRKPSLDSLGKRVLSSIPDVIEGHGNTTSTSTSTTTTASISSGGSSKQPEGERAEAEGCEHSAIESVEEARVTYNKSGQETDSKMADGNIQAVHVIILSEQL